MRHDYTLLAVGLARCGFWIFGTFYALRFRRLMVGVGFAIAAVTSFVFSFVNAAFNVPAWIVHTSAYVGSLSTAAIICGFILGTRLYPRHKTWTP